MPSLKSPIPWVRASWKRSCERALLKELHLRGIRAASQRSFPVFYKGEKVGEYFADILVEDILVIELKCADRLTNEHLAQGINYLRASGRQLCLLVNFQKPTVEWKRVANQFLPSCIEQGRG